MTSDIPELLLLEEIEELSEAYELTFGAPPVNLSTWNPSHAVLGDLTLTLPQRAASWIDYSFSYDLAERAPLLARLGYSSDKFGCIVVHSGSTAIVCVANWLRVRGVSRVLFLAPRYFSVPHALQAVGISNGVLHVQRTPTGFVVPEISADALRDYDALWITNPVYCTSVDLPARDISSLVELAGSCGLPCVIDECLAEPGRYLGPKLSASCLTVAIYAPHKAICVNGLKFAMAVFPESEQRHFDTWSDVWSGCLPASSVLAVRHFLSSDFERYRGAFKSMIAGTHKSMRTLVEGMPGIALDEGADGYLVSVYASALSADLGKDMDFLRESIWSSGASFIGGIRNELDPRSGLSFRINLAALDTAALGGLARVGHWLTAMGSRAPSL